MRELKFKYLKAENIFCFEELELNFESYGNIVLVRGMNLDVNEEDGAKASNGSGKCFGENTPILMYDGTIKMVQDIKVGDLVMGHDSTPRTVLSLGRGREMLYEVIPAKGDSYVVNKSHMLTLKSSDVKYNRYKNHWSRKGEIFNISVKDYLKESKTFKHMMHGYRSSANFNSKNLLIDPYFVGLWLGDGSSARPAITNVDTVVIKEIKREAAKRNLGITYNGKYGYNFRYNKGLGKDALLAYKLHVLQKLTMKETLLQLKELIPYYKNRLLRCTTVERWIRYVVAWLKKGNKLPSIEIEVIKDHEMTNPLLRNSLLTDLRKLNLINNKHIPLEYKTSSREQRLQLLAGYLDTDGYRNNGGYEFVTKIPKLAADIAYLARSLGLACYYNPCQKASQNGTIGTYYRGYISGDCSVIPVKINYKKAKKRKINKNVLVTGIKVKPIGVGNYFGFTLKENPLFLLGDFTVVHNSSIADGIVYALYGKTIKKPKKLTHLNLINNKAKKLTVELHWDNYRVIRKRDSNNKQTLQLWENINGEWVDISKAGRDGAQGEIERKIGLTYESFINIFTFSDDNTLPFLECDGTMKREIVENILSLEKYRGYAENSNNLTKDLKSKIKDLAKEYEFLQTQQESCIKRIAQVEKQELDWKNDRKKELNALLNTIKTKRDELENSNTALAAYQDAQEQIVELKAKVPVLETEKTRLNDILNSANTKFETFITNLENTKKKVEGLKSEYLTLDKLLNENKKILEDKTSKIGKDCPYCLSKVEESNFVHITSKAKEVIIENSPLFEVKKKEYETELLAYEGLNKTKQGIELKINDFKNQLNAKNSEISQIYCEISKLSKISKPDSDVAALLLAEQIENLKKQANDKQEQLNGNTPFETIKQTAVADLNQKTQDCNNKKDEIIKSEKMLPYYEFWQKAFGDKGIRKYIIDGIIPTLNERIEYWLQFLIDNKIKLTFDNELNETIDRYPFNGRPYVYHGLSGGQRRRLNLTVAAAWAFVSELNSGAAPSQIWLDEVTMNVDAVGVFGIYRMICELAKEKQVFVIDHNERLLEMLSGCETIYLEMKDEVSKKVDMLGSNC